MTLLGTEKYLNSQNKSLADKFEMQTIPDFDADTLLATIIRNYQSLPTLFEDPDYMYEETEWWWKQHKAQYARMIQAMLAEYNPIENYDRTETRTGASTTIGNNSSEKNFSQSIDGESHKTGTETTVLDGETKGTGTITEVLDGETKGTGTITEVLDGEVKGTGTIGIVEATDTTVTTDQEDTHNTENRVSAFNESTYQNASKIIEDGTLDSEVVTDSDSTSTTTRNTKDETDNTTTTTRNTKDEVDNTNTTTRNTKDETDNTTTVTHNTTDTNDVDTTSSETVEGTDSSTTNDSYTLRAHGNIGVTTNEQMVSAEILLRLKSFYGIIAKQYSDEMLLSIW